MHLSLSALLQHTNSMHVANLVIKFDKFHLQKDSCIEKCYRLNNVSLPSPVLAFILVNITVNNTGLRRTRIQHLKYQSKW